MTNSVSSNRSENYNITALFLGVWGIELKFEQTNEFRVVYANEFYNYVRQIYQLSYPDTPSAFFKQSKLYYNHPNKYY
jgi:DNA (cytosine-5)-methyltransferase 1